ncbi:MAG: hypothetical protein LQ338_007775 [Usnochroma carphineum]|nr:MAG: hypothetical protein LQ338_007775 [Usnochroma carphineum]
MTETQAARLTPWLNQWENTVKELYLLTSSQLRTELPTGAAWDPWRRLPMKQLDEAIFVTRDRSHRQEILNSANELFHVTYNFPRGINSYGLRALDEFNVLLDEELGDVLPEFEKLLALFIETWDLHAGILDSLRDLGLSHCIGILERSLSEGEPELWDGGHNTEEVPGLQEASSWGANWMRKWSNWGRPPRVPVSMSLCPYAGLANANRGQILSIADALSIGVFHYWSIYTILYDLRRHNILLYRSANSYLPPSAFFFWELAVNSTRSIFALPPFRHPTGAVRPNPLQLSKQENDTLAALDRTLRNRTLLRDSRNDWLWSHPSTPEDALRPFPSQIPCPRGLDLRPGSPASLLCNSSLSSPEVPFYPFADPTSTTYQRLLGLRTMRDVFALILDLKKPLDRAIVQHMDFMDAQEKEVGQRKRENAARRGGRRG